METIEPISNIKVIALIKTELEKLDFIESAILYGSSVKNESSRDIDIAIILNDESGVIPSYQYKILYDLRNKITQDTGFDIDLVPHTRDELDDKISPLFNPRYNPAISNGLSLKSELKVPELKEDDVKISDLSRYVLLDNRTITRRQLIRSLKREEFSIFLSKLAHTPGNILTFRAILKGEAYYVNPTDLDKSAEILDSQNANDDSKEFILKIKTLKSIVQNSLIPYNENTMFKKACEIMNDFEKIITKEFYPQYYIYYDDKTRMKGGVLVQNPELKGRAK